MQTGFWPRYLDLASFHGRTSEVVGAVFFWCHAGSLFEDGTKITLAGKCQRGGNLCRRVFGIDQHIPCSFNLL